MPSSDLLAKLQSALSYGDEKGLCHLLETGDAHSVAECLTRDPTLFVQACGQGFTSAVNFFLQNCGHNVNLLAEFEMRTALQWACLRGHLEVVEQLLRLYQQRGLSLERSAWLEHSEFYSAAVGGHVDVLRTLLVHCPEVVKEEDVCQALLYASCVGGHLPMVKQWVRPNLNVNHQVTLVATLHACEHMTPFQAACEGGHKAVAALLMEEFGAEVTAHLADTLPTFTAELVHSVYQPLKVTQEQVRYNLAGVGTHVLQPSWLQSHLTLITHLDVSANKLKELPACVPWALASLQHLKVAHNQLCALPPPPVWGSSQAIECHQLLTVDASHNRLREVCVELFQQPSLLHLDLSHNALHRLNQILPSAMDPTEAFRQQWRCDSLQSLKLAHNRLDYLPADQLKNCPALTTLDVSHNQLSSLPAPWDCRLEKLDVSHNCLERFPPSTEQYWSGSLRQLLLHHNCLQELNENVLKFGMLQKLDASHNGIQHLAPAHLWDCPALEDLNLAHNRLGLAQQRRPQASAPHLPSDLLSEELRSLDLSHNDLTHVPLSVCYIRNLAMLDISHNAVKELPAEMGNLAMCWDLRLQGLRLQKPLQDLAQGGRVMEVIEHLRKQLRKVQPCHILKVLVIGPQNKGKSTVIESLVRGNPNQVTQSQHLVTVTTTTLKPQGSLKIKERNDKDRPVVTLRIWEVAGSPELAALQPLLWSENCLFLLVWDMTEAVNGLRQWLSSIKSRLDRVSVVLVATFRDRIPAADVERCERQFHSDVNALYGCDTAEAGLYPKEDNQRIFPPLLAVVAMTRHMQRQDVAGLKKALYCAALSLVKVVRPVEFVVGQQLPHSYLVVEDKLQKMAARFKQEQRPPFLTQQELDDLCCDPAADFHAFDDQLEAVKMWSQMGSVLHFDVWAEGLSRLYFLDPDWLASMAALVLRPGGAVPYRQALRDVHLRLASEGYPQNIFRPFLQLLKYFDIGAPLSNQESLLLPCLLPKRAPGLELAASSRGRKLLRFYAMPHVPSRLWARLILAFLMSMDRFSQSCWQGQEGREPQLTYWQEGLTIRYGRGTIVIESSMFVPTEEKGERCGILISILTDCPALGDLAVLGFVSDQLDSALQTIFPHYVDNAGLFGIFALCPVCFHEVEPGCGVIRGPSLHFALADCAGDLLHSDFAQCHRGNKVALEDLIPELLMGELPEHLHLTSDLHRSLVVHQKLGGGAAGTVYRGELWGRAVAVKEFFRSREEEAEASVAPALGDERLTSDSGTSTWSSSLSTCSSADSGSFPDPHLPSDYGNFRQVWQQQQQALQRRQDHITGRNLKVCRAFSELRQETVILSQLSHPCLISLLGVSIRPSLLVVLELAPLGSLRSVLSARVKNRPFNKYHDRDRTFTTVLDKDITFKMVYQVGLGLQYLHSHRIVYRDLKSDNILVCSLDVDDAVNVKISDYGISKFTTSQGMMGMVGTPGYIAPEIMDGQAYDEKVDIFSFSMVMYELLTGHPPFEKYSRLHQLHQLINYDRCRPSLMEYNVICNFPYLEKLMEVMWAHDPHDRPSATAIVRQMEDVGFVLQHSQLARFSDGPERGRSDSTASSVEGGLFCNVTCVWALNETSRASAALGRNVCWVWESPSAHMADRRLCVYNLASGKPLTPSCKDSPGQPVSCMAQINQHRWVGSVGDPEDDSQEARVDIFPIRCVDSAKGKVKLDSLEADPVAIVQDRNNPNKEKLGAGGEGLVYVALCNGTIHIYRHHAKRSPLSPKLRHVPLAEWQHFKTLTVTAACPLQTLCLVPSRQELVAGCGHSVVVISTDTLLVERRLCPFTSLPPAVRVKVSAIEAMARNEDTLWCSFRGSPLVVEFDMGAWSLARAYCIEADLEVYIREVTLLRRPGTQPPPCRACWGVACPPRDAGQGAVRGGEGSGVGDRDSGSPPPRPPSSTKPGVSALLAEGAARDAGAPAVDPVQMRPKQTRAAHRGLEVPSGPHDLVFPEEADPPEQRTHQASSHRKISCYGGGVFSGQEEQTPELPPRRVKSDYRCEKSAASGAGGEPSLSKNMSHTLPNLATTTPSPSPSPQRRSLPSEHEGVCVQSLLCVEDTLWVGSSCGEILVIAVQERPPPEKAAHTDPDLAPSARKSLSLEARQVCNLLSVRMSGDRQSGGGRGGVGGRAHSGSGAGLGGGCARRLPRRRSRGGVGSGGVGGLQRRAHLLHPRLLAVTGGPAQQQGVKAGKVMWSVSESLSVTGQKTCETRSLICIWEEPDPDGKCAEVREV